MKRIFITEAVGKAGEEVLLQGFRACAAKLAFLPYTPFSNSRE